MSTAIAEFQMEGAALELRDQSGHTRLTNANLNVRLVYDNKSRYKLEFSNVGGGPAAIIGLDIEDIHKLVDLLGSVLPAEEPRQKK